MDKNNKIHENLINLLKLFKDRPYHLSKYLIDNNALNDSFIKKLSESDIKDKNIETSFEDINHINEYFNSIFDDKNEKIKEALTSLNKKLDQLIKDEKYEEAIYVRDYMKKNNIPRINF